MSNIANIAVYDGQSTPVLHTFVADSVSKSGNIITALWKETVAGVPDEAQGRLTMKRATLKSGVVRTSVRVDLPVMESVSGVNAAGYTAAPKVAYVDSTEVVNYSSKRATIAGRRSCRMLAVNVSNNIGTSVAAATSGPVSELIDLLITPT